MIALLPFIYVVLSSKYGLDNITRNLSGKMPLIEHLYRRVILLLVQRQLLGWQLMSGCCFGYV